MVFSLSQYYNKFHIQMNQKRDPSPSSLSLSRSRSLSLSLCVFSCAEAESRPQPALVVQRRFVRVVCLTSFWSEGKASSVLTTFINFALTPGLENCIFDFL
ncbi:hypothetical protein F8388_005682 [Cannabis sativa]|uniref:Uncharacterized protein n=1 Tax=Cannabis sativa TaxID=3483 RepID=A0A7J6H8S3_CANSA|nr:hypothetical protein F8388_005682 [Cannabis sativa]